MFIDLCGLLFPLFKSSCVTLPLGHRVSIAPWLEEPMSVPSEELRLPPSPRIRCRRCAACRRCVLDLRAPVTRWSTIIKMDNAIKPLAGSRSCMRSSRLLVLRRTTLSRGGGGGSLGGLGVGGRTEQPLPSTPTPSTVSQTTRKNRPYDSLKDYAAKQGTAH